MDNEERRIVLYVDGSAGAKLVRDGKTLSIGWGVVALHDDSHHEIIKGEFPGKVYAGKQYEFYAFLEGVQYAFSQGFKPHQISIHTDEQQLVAAVFLLHRENYAATETVNEFLARLKFASKPFGPGAYENALACLKEGTVWKAANSEFSLYYNRAHYLANAGRRGVAVLQGGDVEPFLTYDEWLSTVVFTFYMGSEEALLKGVLGPYQPEKATANGAIRWQYCPPFTRPAE
jgi:ribonuclease HI